MARQLRTWTRGAITFAAACSLAILGLVTPAQAATHTSGTPPVTITYGTESPLQSALVYPGPAPSSPLVILIHGGGWYSTSKIKLTSQAQELQSAGYTVFDINYRGVTISQGAFPMEIQDVEAAIFWAGQHASTYNANPKNLILIGGSAGGQLAALAAENFDNLSPHSVSALITLSGVFNFSLLATDLLAGHLDGYMKAVTTSALQCPLATCPAATDAMWSPEGQITNANCPTATLMFNSTAEHVPTDQPTSMAADLTAHSCANTVQFIQGKDHSFAYWDTIEPTVVAFVNAH